MEFREPQICGQGTIGGDSIRLEVVVLDNNNPRTDISGKIIFKSVSGDAVDIGTLVYSHNPQNTLPTGSALARDLASIIINLDRGGSTWWIDPTLQQLKPAAKADFFSIFLHELGHALGFLHAYDLNAPDYKTELLCLTNYKAGESVPANKRMSPTSGAQSVKRGVQKMVKDSYGITWAQGAVQGQIATLGNTIAIPTIIAQPLHQLICTSSTVKTFSVTSAGTNFYQWQSVADIKAPKNINGGTSATYSTSVTDKYRCLVSNNGCSAISNTAVFEKMPLVTIIDSLNKCTTQPIAIAKPTITPPHTITASGAGVTTTNGQVFINPSVANAGTITWVGTNPAQTGQAAQTCSQATYVKAVTLTPALTKIKTCPAGFFVYTSTTKNVAIDNVVLSFLGCYKTGNRFVIQLSKSDGTFDNPTDINTVPLKIVDMTTLPVSNTFNLSIPRAYFTASGNYKLRIVIYTPGNSPEITYSAPSCAFAVNRVATSSLCNTGGNRVAQNTSTSIDATLYPNPTADHFTLQTPEYDNATEVSISDAQGRFIHKQNLFGVSNEIDTHDLPNGLYFVRIAQGERSATLKLVILR